VVNRHAAVAVASLGALVATASCASLVGVHDVSLEWCDQPANHHDFCEDFDHADEANAFAAWPGSPTPPPGTSRTLVPSDVSPPFALDTEADPMPAGVSAATGLETAFPNRTFDDVTLGVDVQVAQANFLTDDPNAIGAGFLLLADIAESADQPSLCIALVLTPATMADNVEISMVLLPNAHDCVKVINPELDSSASGVDSGDAASLDASGAEEDSSSASSMAPVPVPLAEVFENQWIRLNLEVTRAQDGSGTIVFTTGANGGGLPPPTIPPGWLGPGEPTLGIATSVTGPSGAFEIRFDDITLDFHSL
jgi:hypothetical protein